MFLLFAFSYLILGWIQHQQVDQLSLQLASERGHQAERRLVKPTLGNLFLWRSIYLHQNKYYVDAIRLNPFTGYSTLFEGESVERFDPKSNDLNIADDSVLQNDIIRFSSFNSQYLALSPLKQNFTIDVRYSNLPHKINVLWGIRIDPEKPDKHALSDSTGFQ